MAEVSPSKEEASPTVDLNKESPTQLTSIPMPIINTPIASKKVEILTLKDLHDAEKSPAKSPKKRLASSTGTLFVDETLFKPSQPKLIKCTAKYIHNMIRNPTSVSHKRKHALIAYNDDQFELFDERKHPLIYESPEIKEGSYPSAENVEMFIYEIFDEGDLSPEPIILAVAYLKRFCKETDYHMYPYNWRRLLLACLILGSKVWEEAAVWNADFAAVINPKDSSALEGKLLATIQFDVSLKSSDFAKIYFELRDLAPRANFVDQNFQELLPLDSAGEQRLELKTRRFQEKATRQTSKSQDHLNFNSLKLKLPKAVLDV
eukprot:TRINITY_DN6790_c0_g1_i1.p1 TRINITY_DN6790_c0_g1~~TRINITY_DN6790_c0_g1_i1.p1  ORF type:complete len:339 (+),score=65.74 TRINITY_DN6790_c0_g1_i1:63-1019(+)